jgi:nucleotide-binding universal stress UspA family protein
MSWLPKKLVVVPYDFSTEALEAVEAALNFVSDPHQVRVVYALQDLAPLEMAETWTNFDVNIRREHALKAMREKLADPRYADMQLDVVLGDAGHAIPNYASELGAELIVLTSHGYTGLKRLLIGSVAERIVRYAHCPVLVLRK